MVWRVEILNQEVAEELEALPADMRAKLEHIVKLIREFGLERVREPHVKTGFGKCGLSGETGSPGRFI